MAQFNVRLNNFSSFFVLHTSFVVTQTTKIRENFHQLLTENSGNMVLKSQWQPCDILEKALKLTK